MEMLKALSAVSVDSSLLRIGPQENPWLLLGVSGPFLLHLFVLYSSTLGLPALGESFGMVCIWYLLGRRLVTFSSQMLAHHSTVLGPAVDGQLDYGSSMGCPDLDC
jgi:hypothetical protein